MYKLITKKLIEKIFASKRMQEYLIERFDDFNDRMKSDVIGGSLLDLEEKYNYAKVYNLSDLKQELKNAIDGMMLKNDEIFYLKKMNRNDVYELIKEEKLKEIGEKYLKLPKLKEAIEALEDITTCLNSPQKVAVKPFFEYKNILRYIDFEINEETEDNSAFSKKQYNDYYYYIVEKWKRIDPENTLYKKSVYEYGDMVLKSKYYIVNQKTVFCEQFENGQWSKVQSRYLDNSANLNIPVPFNGGDILHINMKPFMNDVNVLFLTKGDNNDCCSAQVLYIDEKEILRQGALKHSNITWYHDWIHSASPLYCITDDEPILKGKELIFKEMAKK